MGPVTRKKGVKVWMTCFVNHFSIELSTQRVVFPGYSDGCMGRRVLASSLGVASLLLSDDQH